eukprot:scaffold260431_cov39-Prasinocladus_malaysianus.AAC.1
MRWISLLRRADVSLKAAKGLYGAKLRINGPQCKLVRHVDIAIHSAHNSWTTRVPSQGLTLELPIMMICLLCVVMILSCCLGMTT